MKKGLKIIIYILIISLLALFIIGIYIPRKKLYFLSKAKGIDFELSYNIIKYSQYYGNNFLYITSIGYAETEMKMNKESYKGKIYGDGVFQLSLEFIHVVIAANPFLRGRDHKDPELQAIGVNMHIRMSKDAFIAHKFPLYEKQVIASQIYCGGIGYYWRGKRSPKYATRQAAFLARFKKEWLHFVVNPFKWN